MIKQTRSGALRRGAASLSLLAFVAVAGCDGLLDVENPNNVVQEDLDNAQSVNAVVNGALSLAAAAVGDVAVATSVLADELEHTGSQNWAAELNVGSITNAAGRSDALFDGLAEARWMADLAIDFTTTYQADLPNPGDVGRANLISGIVYMTIADNFEDFTFSNRTEVGPPVGEANMATLYDTAIQRFGNASGVEATALSARAAWAQELWGKLNPQGSVPSNPLVSNAQADQWAAQVLSDVGGEDWVYTMSYSATTQSNPQGAWINSRQEFVVGPRYAVADGTGKQVDFVSLEDPIDGVADPALSKTVDDFVTAFLYPDLVVTSAREMHLILAESALANNDEATAVMHINAVRAFKGSTAYDPATHSQTVLEMLQHERRVNLFFMPTRRIWDMYRFGIMSDSWAPGSDATRAGQMFVIGQSERISNCYILGTCSG